MGGNALIATPQDRSSPRRRAAGARARPLEEKMESVEEFLAYAIKLESEAAQRFGQLADVMQSSGNGAVAKLFRQLSEYSRMHQAEAQARSGFRDIPKLSPTDFVWPDLESPEAAAIWAADPMLGRGEALEVAMQAELAGLRYYQAVFDTTDDPEIKVLAKEFVAEESEHVAALEKWIAAHKAGRPLPIDA
jgi:rubrerythrin